ncbi:MAG: GNAT family N-acetyltransferase [Ktedonobacterales bacterium]|nr:GNAT family N-acetyltransferase [Ktedonobacterales bacterium]
MAAKTPDTTIITLREITRANYSACLGLRVAPEQEPFVATNAVSLAEAKYEPEMVPLGIYAGERMVGFAMYGYNEADGAHWIHRLMVDVAYQHHGYGRAALRLVLARLRALPECARIAISWNPDNAVAERLYLSEGFTKTGEVLWQELVGRMRVRA